jgi:carboxypeptidase family protein
VTSKLVALLLLGSAALALVSEARPSHDYMFGITGVVTAQDGAPLQDVEITLEVNGPVYEGVEPVKTVKRLTNNTGGFVFTYTSHKRGVKYTLTVRKEGFEPQTVSGAAPPAGHHTIRLKKVGSNGTTPRPN